MPGLRKICKLYGRISIQGVVWVWDYHNDEPVKQSEMKADPERYRLSEVARAKLLKEDADAS